jgi:2-methylisocitrate lyase-like PEP mutase family enzyme
MTTQKEKGESFYAMHHRTGAFIMPNPWDAGSARMLANLGFEALATTSAGFAFSSGQLDGTMNRDETLAHSKTIADATDLPVSVDFGDGFGDEPEAAAETIRLASATGVVGGSIEDVPSTRDVRAPYEIAHAADRVRAAVEAARALPFRLTLTARAENFIVGRPDIRDTIARLQAFQEAGADVLYAPGLTAKEDIVAVVKAVDRPVNVVMGLTGASHTLAELSKMGVKRVSVGSALARTAYTAMIRAGREMLESGDFRFARDAESMREFTALLRERSASA